MQAMRWIIATCVVLAIASVVAAVVGDGMARDPDCWDPPCPGAKDTLIIFGRVGTVTFGAAALILSFVWALVAMWRRE